MRKKIYKWLRWATNNGKKSTHEAEWDIGGFVVATLSLIVGVYLIKIKSEYMWLPFLVIEYLWYIDNMRNNRDY